MIVGGGFDGRMRPSPRGLWNYWLVRRVSGTRGHANMQCTCIPSAAERLDELDLALMRRPAITTAVC
jgi:hypothetical protein